MLGGDSKASYLSSLRGKMTYQCKSASEQQLSDASLGCARTSPHAFFTFSPALIVSSESCRHRSEEQQIF